MNTVATPEAAAPTPAATFEVQIEHVIVHDLIKVKNGPATIDLRDDELPITPLVRTVVDTLAREYRQRASKSHGRFDMDDAENSPVPTRIRQYAIDRTLDFVHMSRAMVATLRDRAHAQSASTGGHVLIAHVRQSDGVEGLLIAILTEEIGAAITDTKDLEESRYLNMKGFRYAGRVDLTGLASNAERYVSFLRGSGRAEVSDYFKLFLGCDTTIVARQETMKLTDALKAFATEHTHDERSRADFLLDANDFCIDLANQGEIFEVESFANRMWPNDPALLVSALESPELALASGFVPHKGGLRGLVKFTGAKTGLWKVEFDRQALLHGDIVFDSEHSTLTITRLPDELLARLNEELSD